jgi:transcriptional regulator with XRE-family HTH domain
MGRSIHTRDHRRLAELLRRLREDAGLRQSELAARLDRPQSFVSKYEAGERRLDLIELRAICVALDASVVELVQRWDIGVPEGFD